MADRTGVIWIKSGSTNIAKITVTQQAGENKYFYFDDGSTSATTKELNALSGDTSVTCQYVTNYDGLTSATTSVWITGASLNNGTLTVNFSANPDTNIRTGTVYIKYNDETVGTLTITQAKKMFFLWGNNTSAITQTIAATTTTGSASYTTNYTGLTVESAASYSWITNKSLSNPSGNGTFGVTAQTNETISGRTSVFNIKNGNTIVGVFNLTQGAGSPYFYVGKSVTLATTTAVTITCASADTLSVIMAEPFFFKTNIVTNPSELANITLVSSVPAMFDSTSSFINNVDNDTLIGPDGIESNLWGKFYCNTNTGQPRTCIVTINSGSTSLAQVTIQQEGIAPKYVYVGNSYSEATTSACSYSTIVSKDGDMGSFYGVTNYSVAEMNTFTITGDSDFISYDIYPSDGTFTVSWNLGENYNREITKTLYIKSGSTVLAEMYVYQEYVDVSGSLGGIPTTIPLTGGTYNFTVLVNDSSYPHLSESVSWEIQWDWDKELYVDPQSGTGDGSGTITFYPGEEAEVIGITLYGTGVYDGIEIDSVIVRWYGN